MTQLNLLGKAEERSSYIIKYGWQNYNRQRQDLLIEQMKYVEAHNKNCELRNNAN